MMAQLSLFDVKDSPISATVKILEPIRCDKVLCEWTTEFETRDEEYQPLFFKTKVRCREAFLKRKIDGKMKVVPGYRVEILETIRDEDGEIAEELATYENSFLQKERREAIKDYSFCVRQIHLQLRVIGESRVKTLKETKKIGDWYECCNCGYMELKFFDTCRGCGRRFMKIGKDE